MADERRRGTGLDPGLLLGTHRRDWYLLLTLWCIRQASTNLLILGLIPPLLVGQLTDDLASQLDTPEELAGALLSPLALIAVAIVLRFAVGVTSLGLAFPLRVNGAFDPAATPARSPAMQAVDRLTLARGRGTLRWSWAVRRTASQRLGRRGTVLDAAGRLLTACLPVSIIAVGIVSAVVAG